MTSAASMGQPRLDAVDRARLAGRHVAAVAAALGAVERGDERGAVQRRRACRRPTPPASRGHGRCRAPSRRGGVAAGRSGGWPTRRGRRARRRGATACRCAPAAPRMPSASVVGGRPGWASVISTTSCPDARKAWPARRRARRCRRRRPAGTPTTASGPAWRGHYADAAGECAERSPVHEPGSAATTDRLVSGRVPDRASRRAPVCCPGRSWIADDDVTSTCVRSRRPACRWAPSSACSRSPSASAPCPPAASVAQACVMSLLVFTGASQFSAVSVVAAGGSTACGAGRRRCCSPPATACTA